MSILFTGLNAERAASRKDAIFEVACKTGHRIALSHHQLQIVLGRDLTAEEYLLLNADGQDKILSTCRQLEELPSTLDMYGVETVITDGRVLNLSRDAIGDQRLSRSGMCLVVRECQL